MRVTELVFIRLISAIRWHRGSSFVLLDMMVIDMMVIDGQSPILELS